MQCSSNPHTQCHTEKGTPVHNRTKQSISSHSSLCSAFFLCLRVVFCECSIWQKRICSLTGCVKRLYSELCRACTGHWLYLLSPQSFHICFWHFLSPSSPVCWKFSWAMKKIFVGICYIQKIWHHDVALRPSSVSVVTFEIPPFSGTPCCQPVQCSVNPPFWAWHFGSLGVTLWLFWFDPLSVQVWPWLFWPDPEI